MFYSKEFKKFKKIKHCFFSRKGGFSKGIYQSLNCGKGSKDKKKNVYKNLSKVSKKISLKADEWIVWHCLISTIPRVPSLGRKRHPPIQIDLFPASHFHNAEVGPILRKILSVHCAMCCLLLGASRTGLLISVLKNLR